MSESRHPHSERRLRLGLERLGLDEALTAPLMMPSCASELVIFHGPCSVQVGDESN